MTDLYSIVSWLWPCQYLRIISGSCWSWPIFFILLLQCCRDVEGIHCWVNRTVMTINPISKKLLYPHKHSDRRAGGDKRGQMSTHTLTFVSDQIWADQIKPETKKSRTNTGCRWLNVLNRFEKRQNKKWLIRTQLRDKRDISWWRWGKSERVLFKCLRFRREC